MRDTLTKSRGSFVFAWNGIKTAWREEHNFRIAIVGAMVVIAAIIYLRFSYIESALCAAAIALVLMAELANTAVEDLCDKVEPQHDPAIGKIKDLMAGFALVALLSAIAIGILVFGHHFGILASQ